MPDAYGRLIPSDGPAYVQFLNRWGTTPQGHTLTSCGDCGYVSGHVAGCARVTRVAFDGSPSWPAEVVGHWNGFAIPRVTQDTREAIARWADATEGEDGVGAEVRAVSVDEDGLVTLRGFAFGEPDVQLSALQARAVFHGWPAEERGPVDMASEADLAAYVDAWSPLRGGAVFIVNGEATPCSAEDYIEANRHDPEALYGVGALQVGETWGGGAGGDVRRIA